MKNNELNKLVNDGQNLNTEFIIKYFKDDVCLENNNHETKIQYKLIIK